MVLKLKLIQQKKNDGGNDTTDAKQHVYGW